LIPTFSPQGDGNDFDTSQVLVVSHHR